MKNTKTKQFNPAWLTPVSSQDLKHTRGIQVADFINTFCVQTKDTVAGRAGERIVLREWQVELLKHIFAVEQNKLKHRSALVGMARKNGKSALSSGIALWGLFQIGRAHV